MSMVPAEGDDVPEVVHAPGARMRSLLSRTNPTIFNDPVISEFYVDLFLSMCNELERVPGYGIATEVLVERYAFLSAQMKAFDLQDSPLPPQQYERLIMRLTQLFDRMLKGRDERHADEAFKRQFMSAMTNAVAEAIEELVPDRNSANELLAGIARHMRKTSEVERTAS